MGQLHRLSKLTSLQKIQTVWIISSEHMLGFFLLDTCLLLLFLLRLPKHLLHLLLVETCACVLWPEGRAGELEGVVRLLRRGIMKLRVST